MSYFSKRSRTDDGSALIDVVLAVFIVSVAIAGWMSASATASMRTLERQDREIAQELTLNALEIVRVFKCDVMLGAEFANAVEVHDTRCAAVADQTIEVDGTDFELDNEVRWVGITNGEPSAQCDHYIPTGGWGSLRPTQLQRIFTVTWTTGVRERSITTPILTAFPPSLLPEGGDQGLGSLVVSNAAHPVSLLFINPADGSVINTITRHPDPDGCVWFPYLYVDAPAAFDDSRVTFEWAYRVEDGTSPPVEFDMRLPYTARFHAVTGDQTNPIPRAPNQLIEHAGGIAEFCSRFPVFCPQPEGDG